MKLLKLLWLALLLPSLAQASLTVNNAVGNFASTTTTTVTISIASGHTVVVCTYGKGAGGTVGTITDSASNTYTIGTSASGSTFISACSYNLAIASSITSVTYTPSGTATESGAIVWDVTATGTIGVASGATNAKQYSFNSVTATDGTITNSLTLTQTDGLLIGFGRDGSSGTLTAGTAYTADVHLSTNAYLGEHKAASASASATMTDSNANNLVMTAGIALQVTPPVVVNGVVMSNGHPVQSGTSILYQ